MHHPSYNVCLYFFLLLLITLSSEAAWLGDSFPGPTARTVGAPPPPRTNLFSSSRKHDENDNENDNDATTAAAATAQELQRQAAQLRQQVDSWQQSKLDAAQREQRAREEEQTAAALQRERYSAVLPIFKPDGTTVLERCDFPPRYRDDDDDDSYIITCESELPLGVILGESQEIAGGTTVDEVTPGSHGAAAGLRQGDLVRAVTACQRTMQTPTWQILAGGIGVPKTTRFVYAVDGRPLEEVLEAVLSNRQDPEQRPVLLVVERRRRTTDEDDDDDDDDDDR